MFCLVSLVMCSTCGSTCVTSGRSRLFLGPQFLHLLKERLDQLISLGQEGWEAGFGVTVMLVDSDPHHTPGTRDGYVVLCSGLSPVAAVGGRGERGGMKAFT